MDEKVVPNAKSLILEDKSDGLYPMYFGVSCAFFAVRLLSLPHNNMEDEKWCDIREKMLQGSAQLLGLLVWRVQREESEKSSELLLKLENAEAEVTELKRLRREDAKANEKVVSIFAAQEQNWLVERRKLRQHIGSLMSELRFLEKKRDQAVLEMNEKFKEMETLLQSKDKVLEEESEKRRELEEKIKDGESLVEELREKAKQESQDHSSELRKHKTAFIELVSNQRRLEADMSRAVRQVEGKKRELDSVLKQKEESVLMVQKLSGEIVKMHDDLEQKDKILSATLRKFKMDSAEKQMLLKEVKLSKAKRKQAELETERWKAVSESRQERHSLRNMLAKQVNSSERGPTGSSHLHIGHTKSQPSDVLMGFEHAADFSNESDGFSPPYDSNRADVKQVESWVRSEAERYASAIEQRHRIEIDAFVEQLRLKDEKVEAFRWRLLSMELESKRLQSHIEGLNKELSQLRHNNMKMGALLSEREEELNSMKEQFVAHLRSLNFQKNSFNSSSQDSTTSAYDDHASCSQQLNSKEQETKTVSIEMSAEEGTDENPSVVDDQSRRTDMVLTVQSPDKEFDEQKEFVSHEVLPEGGSSSPSEGVDGGEKLKTKSVTQKSLSRTNSSQWRMDLHALGVAYKLKRLKQQLVMLESLRGKQESGEDNKEKNNNNNDGESDLKSVISLISLLNKQVGRYQSLQTKVDDLCKRMHDSDLELYRRDSNTTRTKEKTKKLEHFLEETFQLQRYIVATGQKLMEIQSKISAGLAEDVKDLGEPVGSFDMKRFADAVRTLFHDVQRGLEVRIAKVIGDLEGTLACEGMICLRR
ncbi:hypothetical protein G4B88_023661 [Cannabis sativa]|uniref:Uncharacterized protein n=2 Tax=Cannabis sativa TaxID=3483 RepID=A0AB40E6E4_CANSA|nr:hypothetical protein G4B88_023661 [Cannabis sativa]